MSQQQRPFGQINNLQILGYNFGISIEVVTMSTYTLLAMPIYCIALGVNPAWIGVAFLIPRIWDAITDPMVGCLSDNTKAAGGAEGRLC